MFALSGTGFSGKYSLELDLAMVGRSSDLAPAEQWDVTFTVHTPAMTITPVPEPSTPAILALGIGVLGWALRRSRVRARTGATRS